MRKVFKVELATEDRFTELTLPATPYALLDALEKLELKEGEAPHWEVLSTSGYGSLSSYLDDGGALPELNALTQRLSQLSETEQTIVEGLAKAANEQGKRIVSIPQMIDFAYSTDCCHLVESVVTDAQLGRFYAENGFVPEAEGLSDAAFELLDFVRIGKQFREAEGGVFARGGYVQRREELKQVYKTLDLTPRKPDYAVLAELPDGSQVRLPAPLGETTADAPSRCVDCAAPSLIGLTAMRSTLDMLARYLTELELDGGLTKYKAVLEAARCDDISRALTLADGLDRYSFDPEPREPDELAIGHLKELVPEEELKALLSHVNLYQYGQAVMEQTGGELTGYGYVRSSIGPTQDIAAQTEEMEMTLS